MTMFPYTASELPGLWSHDTPIRQYAFQPPWTDERRWKKISKPKNRMKKVSTRSNPLPLDILFPTLTVTWSKDSDQSFEKYFIRGCSHSLLHNQGICARSENKKCLRNLSTKHACFCHIVQTLAMIFYFGNLV